MDILATLSSAYHLGLRALSFRFSLAEIGISVRISYQVCSIRINIADLQVGI